MDALTWGAAIAATGSIIACIKFWLDMGKLVQRANDAFERGNIRDAKYELLVHTVSDFKIDVAKTYATSGAVAEVERQTARTIEHAMAGVSQRLDGLTTRIDSLITMASRRSDP